MDQREQGRSGALGALLSSTSLLFGVGGASRSDPYVRATVASIEKDLRPFQKSGALVSVFLGMLFPLCFAIDDLLRGREVLVLNYGLSFLLLLGLFLWIFRRDFSKASAWLLVFALQLGFVFSVLMPRARSVYILILIGYTPLVYLLCGASGGRKASLSFIALIGFLVAAARAGIIHPWIAFRNNAEYAMVAVTFLLMNVLASASEGRHLKNISLLSRRHHSDRATGLLSGPAFELEELDPGDAVLLVSLGNYRDLAALVDPISMTSLASRAGDIVARWRSTHSSELRGPFRLAETEFGFILPPDLKAEAASGELLALFSEAEAIPGSPLRFRATIVSWSVDAACGGATAMASAFSVLSDCVAKGISCLHRSKGCMDDRRGELRFHAPALLDNIKESRFRSVFQPVYDRQSDGIGFAEALVRLDVDGRLVSPESYLDTALRLGLDGYITDFILEEATCLAERSGCSVSLNVTFRDLEQASFGRALASAYGRLQGGPATLIIELTEHTAFTDLGRISRFVREVHGMGGLVLLDDLGSGYSNYASLLEARFDGVKIAGEIVREIAVRPEAETLYRGMTAFCEAAGLAIVAEHISDEAILAKAEAGGARYLQGYLFSPPVPAEDFLSGSLRFPGGRAASAAPRPAMAAGR